MLSLIMTITNIDVSNMPGTHVATNRICMLENIEASHESLQLLQDVCH